jgi:ribosomal protein L7/L12
MDSLIHSKSINNLILVQENKQLAESVLLYFVKFNPEIFNRAVGVCSVQNNIQQPIDIILRNIVDEEGYPKCKIKLIKTYRQHTNCYLKDAKDYVESLFATEQAEHEQQRFN